MHVRHALLASVLLLAGFASPAAAQSGHALAFFPFNCKRVGVPLNAPTAAFTLEAWAHFDGDPEAFGTYPIFSFGDDSPFFGVSGDFLRVLSRSGLIVQTEGLPVGKWQHVAYTFDGTTSRLYVNGALAASADVAPPTNGVNLGLGCHIGDTVWPGYLDEVIIWDEARTEAEIAADLGGLSAADVADPALVAYFKFDEGAGQVARNEKAAGPDGMLGNTPEVDLLDPTWVAVSAIPTPVDPVEPTAASLALALAGPNPLATTTTLRLEVALSQRVRVAVYDALGRAVALLHDGLVAAGTAKTLTFEAGTLPSGLYLVRAEGENRTITQRIVVAR